MFHIFKLVFLVGFLVEARCVSEEEVEEYTTWLQNAQKKAQNGHLRTDNSEFKPSTDEDPEDFGEFDFIIVGAGATGTILANRLSEERKWKILLLEAGGFPNNFTYTPINIDLSRNTQFNWGYKTVPQKHSCLGMNDAECVVPRGKGLGGTTLVNGLMYVRGYPIDFDRWAALGNPGWSYKEVLPLFKRTESMVKNNPEAVVDWSFHGKDGPLHTEFFPTTNVQMEALYKSLQLQDLDFTDVNTYNQIGFSPKAVNIKNGRRFDDGTAFILPILDRKNLKVQIKSYAIKINFDSSKKARGVIFSHQKKLYEAKASKEVIVSGGSINTPQLLMLSGVGPKKHLKKHNIKVVSDLKVGEILREHATYYGLVYSSNYTEPIKPFKEYVREFLHGKGPLTLPGGARIFGFIKSKYEKTPKYPDIEFMFIAGNCTSPAAKQLYNWKDETWKAVFQDLNPAQCFSIAPILVNPKSTGWVKLKSNDPYEFPRINLNHLAEEIDAKTLYQAVKFFLKVAESEPFKKVNAKLEQKPLPACQDHKFGSKKYWYCSMAQLTYNIYHPVGSCPMGPDPEKGYVVNHELKVHGVKKLRVADASVFPFALRGHPNAPCVMIGDKLADMLKKQYK